MMRINFDYLSDDEKFFIGENGNVEVVVVDVDYTGELAQYFKETAGFINSKHLSSETISEYGVI